ncbi:pentatricopeptide repeat-containing protein ELI1, chloroplastic-like [Pistacia vera]|uniref:pentatricopeptide repeat-containing protein ELI1, chloroplastic-like n=1 Tax=Pistacia vera TaxID=55513 RepID=UPI0012631BB8|nr:pentatricopeptide repeat-containing protein ELI1, chloroplastic-like [Pistacia vera]
MEFKDYSFLRLDAALLKLDVYPQAAATVETICKIHGNLQLGEQIAKTLLDCGNADSGTYILLSNAYASTGKWKEAAQMRVKMKEAGIQKEPGCSSIEVNNEIHEFILGAIRHPQREKIYKKLEELNQMLKLKGYSPSTEVVLHDIEDREKEWALAIHSERLAICYGLISTKPYTPLRVVKNLRVCNDCHTMIKLIAKITERKIVVRDRNRFHHFENGACSCGDYW